MDDVKQVPYLGPRNIKCNQKKFIRPENLAKFCAIVNDLNVLPHHLLHFQLF